LGAAAREAGAGKRTLLEEYANAAAAESKKPLALSKPSTNDNLGSAVFTKVQADPKFSGLRKLWTTQKIKKTDVEKQLQAKLTEVADGTRKVKKKTAFSGGSADDAFLRELVVLQEKEKLQEGGGEGVR
ncbi:unnamed protein product, partial [Amoebophrya sp. A25]